METMGKRIKHLRKQFRISQQELAEKNNISRATISKMENDSLNPTAAVVLTLSKIFDVSVDWILTGKGSTGNILLNKVNCINENDKEVETEKHIEQKTEHKNIDKSTNKNTDEINLEHMDALSREEIYLVQKFRKLPRIMQVKLEGYIDGMISGINR